MEQHTRRTVNRGSGLVHHPVAFDNSVWWHGKSPRHVQSGAGDFRESNKARSTGGYETTRKREKAKLWCVLNNNENEPKQIRHVKKSNKGRPQVFTFRTINSQHLSPRCSLFSMCSLLLWEMSTRVREPVFPWLVLMRSHPDQLNKFGTVFFFVDDSWVEG